MLEVGQPSPRVSPFIPARSLVLSPRSFLVYFRCLFRFVYEIDFEPKQYYCIPLEQYYYMVYTLYLDAGSRDHCSELNEVSETLIL